MTDQDELLRTHPSLKNFLRLFILPLVGVPGIILALRYSGWPSMPFYPWMLLVILIGLLFPAYAWLQTRFQTYIVRPHSLMSRRGIISRNTHEIRIADIRVINVRQGILQRVLNIGDVGFASAASDQEEVVFANVSDPQEIKRVVQGQMKDLERTDE